MLLCLNYHKTYNKSVLSQFIVRKKLFPFVQSVVEANVFKKNCHHCSNGIDNECIKEVVNLSFLLRYYFSIFVSIFCASNSKMSPRSIILWRSECFVALNLFLPQCFSWNGWSKIKQTKILTRKKGRTKVALRNDFLLFSSAIVIFLFKAHSIQQCYSISFVYCS